MPPERYGIDGFFATGCVEHDKEWIFDMSTPQPLKPYEQALDLTEFEQLTIPKIYVRCADLPGGPLARQGGGMGNEVPGDPCRPRRYDFEAR